MTKFHIGEVLTVSTGIMASLSGTDGVYKILSHMTGQGIYTTQIPRALKICQPAILEQHPQLAEETGQGITKENVEAWVAERVALYGEYLEIEPLPLGEYQKKDPVGEFIEMKELGQKENLY